MPIIDSSVMLVFIGVIGLVMVLRIVAGGNRTAEPGNRTARDPVLTGCLIALVIVMGLWFLTPLGDKAGPFLQTIEALARPWVGRR